MGKDPNYISLQTATKFCDHTQEYLSLRARQGKLKAVKFGRNWVTKEEWLKEYLGKAEEYNGHINNKPQAETVKKTFSFPKINFDFQKIKPAFALGLVFILLTANIAFGKENFKNIFGDVNSGAAKIAESSKKIIAFGKEGTKIMIADIAEESSNFVTDIFSDSVQGVANVGQDISSFADKIDFGVAEIGEGAGKNLNNYFVSAKQNYFAANSFVEKKVSDFARLTARQGFRISDFGKGVIGEIKKGYIAANNFVEEKISDAETGVRNSVSFVGNRVSNFGKKIANRVSNLGKLVFSPWKNILPSRIVEVNNKDLENIQQQVNDLKTKVGKETIRTVEISRVTQIEPVREITKEILKIDDKALAAVRAQLIDMETAIANRLYAPGGVITQQIYIKEPVSSPKIYQENADIILQALGTGNVILTAGTGMQISGSQVVIDSTSVNNPLVYIADRTKINGNTEISGTLSANSFTAQTITLNAPASFSGKILDLQVGGVSQFSVDNTGTMLFNSGLTSSSTLNVYGTTTLATVQGNVGIGTTTPSEKLTVVGNIWGSGNIVLTGTTATSSIASPFYTQATTTFGSVTSTPVFFTGYVKSNILPFSDSAYDFGASNFRWANIYTATATVNNLSALNTLTVAGTTTLATSQGLVGIGTTTPSEMLTIRASSTNAVFGAYSSSSVPLLYITSTGNVGIGKGNYTYSAFPAHTLDLMASSSGATPIVLAIWNSGTGINSGSSIGFQNTGYAWGSFITSKAPQGTLSSAGDLLFQTRQADGTYNNFYIDTNGLVGIGTTTPSEILTIKAASTTAALGVYSSSSAPLLYITPTGLTGIGTTTPSEKLTIVGNIWGSGNIVLTGTTATSSIASPFYTQATTTFGSATSTPVFFTGYVKSSILPFSDSAYNLGASNFRWANIYTATATVDNLSALNTLTVAGTTTLATSQGFVGIGTTTPATKLQVYGNGTYSASFMNGNVGIGTAAPGVKLSIGAGGYSLGDYPGVNAANTLNINSSGATTDADQGYQLTLLETGVLGANKGGAIGFQAYYDGSNNVATVAGIKGLRETATSGQFPGYLAFFTRSAVGSNVEQMRITSTGNIVIGSSTAATLFSVATSTNIFNVTSAGTVGIGTTTPGYTLSVAGNIYGTGNAIFAGTLSSATTTITGGLLPASNLTYNIGSQTAKWANIYVGTTTIGGTITINTDTISATSSLTIIAASTTLISSNNTLTASSSQSMIFTTAGIARLAIDSSGNINATGTSLSFAGTSTFANFVGIGTTTPGYTLSVVGNIYGTGNAIFAGTLSSATTTITGNLLPASNLAYNIGSPTAKWANIYVGTTTIGGTITINSTDITGTGALNITGIAPSVWQTTGTTSTLTIQSASSTIIASNNTLTASSSQAMIFNTAGIARLAIDSSGNINATGTALSFAGTSTFANFVGIGTTTPGYTLSVVGNIYGTGNAIFGGTLSSATTTITGDLLPNANLTYNLGSPTAKWANIYVGTTTIGGTITINSTDITGTGALNITGIAPSVWQTTGTTSTLTIQSASSTIIASNNTLTASSSQAMLFTTAGTERMRILSTGEIGIGNTSPVEKLDITGGFRFGLAPTTYSTTSEAVSAASTTIPVISTTGYPSAGTILIDSEAITYATTTATAFGGATRGVLGTAGATHAINTQIKNYIFTAIANSTTPRMVITGDGNVGIGTTAPDEDLDVNGTIRSRNYISLDSGMEILANMYYTTDYKYRATAGASAIYPDSLGNINFLTVPSGTANTTITRTTRMQILQGGNVIVNTGNVGIGTTTPSEMLTIKATSTNAIFGAYSSSSAPTLYVAANGNVGIGTTNPGNKLDVNGGITTAGDITIASNKYTGTNEGYAMGDTSHFASNVYTRSLEGFTNLKYGGSANLTIQADSAVTNANINFLTGNGAGTQTTRLTIEGGSATGNVYFSNANVGIGTTTPSEMLTVWGGGMFVGTSSIPTLYVASSTGRVGIGTSTPAYTLDVNGTLRAVSTSTFAGATFSGNVGIGTTAPANKLEIYSSGYDSLVSFSGSGNGTSKASVGGFTTTDGGYAYLSGNGYMNVAGSFAFFNDAKPLWATINDARTTVDKFSISRAPANVGGSPSPATFLTIDNGGNVGIGTTAPTSLLEISTASTSQLTITVATDTTSYDPKIVFRTGATPATKFVMGVDFSDSNKFKIATSTLGTNDLLTIDYGTGFVGIATTSPATTFQVYGTSTFMGGNVGIGTTGPLAPLHILGAVNIGGGLGQLNVYSTAAQALNSGGGIEFGGKYNDAGAYTYGANIRTVKESAVTGEYDFGLAFNTRRSTGGDTWTEKVRITSNGNVGIGTTTPAYTLDVYGTLRAVSTSTFAGATFSNSVSIGTTTSLGLFYVATATPAFVITSGGQVGIGTTNPGATLHVHEGTDGNILIRGKGNLSDGGTIRSVNDANNAYKPLEFLASNVIFTTTGNVGIGTTTPSEMLTVWGGGMFVGTSSIPTLYVASSTGRVGIGTSTPAYTLDVNGTLRAVSTSTFAGATFSGNVGIGTTGPGAQLQIHLPTITTATVNSLLISRWTRPQTPNVKWGNSMDILLGSYGTSINSQSRVDFKLADGVTDLPDTTVMTLQGNGNVGIGTTTPEALLNVWGSNASSTLTVAQTGNGNIVDFQAISTSVFTLKSADQLKYRDGLMTTWGDFNTLIQDDFEDNNVADWTSSDTTNTKVSATTTQVKVNDYALAITTVVGSSKGDTATTTATTTDWSGYEKLGFWVMAQYNSTSSVEASTTLNILNFRFKDSGGTTSDATTTIKEFGRWQYKEVDLTVFPSTDKDVVQWLGFRVENDYGSPTFYIDQIRLYDSNERTSEMFVDLNGSLNLVSPSKIEFTRTTPDGDNLPSLSIGTAVVEINQPLVVNVGGDVGMDQDLVFNNTGLSSINSEGPLTISAGNNHGYQNLTLKTGGTGDIIMDIASSTIGFKITGSATTSFGAYVFRVTPTGIAEIGGTLTINGNIIPSTTTSGVSTSTWDLGAPSARWSRLYVGTSTVGDLIFGNQFSITEASTLGINPPEALVFQNASGTQIMKIDESGNLTVDTVRTRQLCVGDTCVTEAQFQAVFNPPTNNPPVANSLSATTTMNVAVNITLSATDADGNSLTYATTSSPTIGVLSGTAPNLTYTPNATGTDSFNYRANDGTANSNTATVSITISE